MTKVVIDPVTRIEGHLRMEVEVENGKVSSARTIGNTYRGFEALLVGKEPRDAAYVAERTCGVCSSTHGYAASMSLDMAYGAKIPNGGRLLRNLIIAAMFCHDHPLHFYHLSALDYLDITAVAKYQGKDPGLLAVKDKIGALITAKDTYPLTPRYTPDEYSVSDPELVTTLVSHYLKALEIQAKARKLSAIFAGKQPHHSSIVAGGVTILPTMAQVEQYRSLLLEITDFIENTYIQDVLNLGTGPLLPLARAGVGAGNGNYLCFGGLPMDEEEKNMFFKSGRIVDNNLSKVEDVDLEKVAEEVSHSWYKDHPDGDHPYKEDTTVDLEKADAYTFVKAPRYDGKPYEVGPLARMFVNQPKEFMDIVDKYGIKPGAVARHAARAFECGMVARQTLKWVDELATEVGSGKIRIHDNEHWKTPDAGQGYGLTEAPRGALGHWIVIKDKKIANFQMVVPTTWNFSPVDANNVHGICEQSLIGVPVSDINNPTNVVRVIRSYDPCLACAIHLIDTDKNEIRKFRIG